MSVKQNLNSKADIRNTYSEKNNIPAFHEKFQILNIIVILGSCQVK